MTAIDGRFEIAEHVHDAVLAGVHLEAAPHRTFEAGRAHNLRGIQFAAECRSLIEQRTGWSSSDARTATRTSVRGAECGCNVHDHPVVNTAMGNIQRVDAFHFFAGADATRAEDAAIVIEREVFPARVDRQ